MLKKFGITLALLLCGCATVPNCGSVHPAKEVRLFFTEKAGVPACAVAVSRQGRIDWAGDRHAIFRVGSLTKCFLTASALRLHEKGVLNLDAPVTRYSRFPLDCAYSNVTMRALMEHRSGLPREFLNPWNPFDWHQALFCGLFGTHLYGSIEDEADFVRGLNASAPALKHPRKIYSNVGFALFSCALEDATGQDLDSLLRRELLGPLSLKDTGFVLDADQRARLMLPCAGKLPWGVRKGTVIDEHELGPVLRGMGGMKSSLVDVVTLFQSVGLCLRKGFHRRRLPSGREIDYCFGMVYGGSAFVAFDRADDDAFVVILMNVTTWPAAENFEIVDRLFAAGSRAP